MIQFENVTKLYKTVIGVNDISIQLPEGAYGLIGPNGSGKTTLINLLTGNLSPTLGRVQVFGKNPWRQRSILGKLGLCPATDLLCPNVSAFEWVRYLLCLSGHKRASSSLKAKEVLEKVGMGEAMRRPIGSYSLGMRQRTKIAQAIAHDPQWLILDEPFNGLDPVGRHDLSDLLRAWGKDGRGLILASHVLHEVEAVSSLFLLIHGGRLLASGSAEEVQSMLVEFPQEIRIRGKGMDILAQQLVLMPTVNSVRFGAQDGSLTVGVRDAPAFFAKLPGIATGNSIQICSIEAPDGNLATAFDSLLRVHRGEIAC